MIRTLRLITIAFLFLFIQYSCSQSTTEDRQAGSVESVEQAKAADETERLAEVNDSCYVDNKSDAIPEVFNSMAEVKKRFNKKPSNFVVKTNRDTVIRCKEGTLLAIPAGAFLSSSDQKPVNGEVKISVKEFYKVSDMLLAGLTTSSGNKLIETGGMLNIKVTTREKNDSCILKPGKNITIAMANVDTNSIYRMQVFNGVHGHDAAGNDSMDWVPRNGISGMAQSWRNARRNPTTRSFVRESGFIFPDEIPKQRPRVINTEPENLKAEIEMTVRELINDVGLVTRKANAYIDTMGNLHCYRFNGNYHNLDFQEMYAPVVSQKRKVNLAVDCNMSYTPPINHIYFLKLFKMGKGNPDSLVTVTVTLNPSAKPTDHERLKKKYASAVTIKEFKQIQKYRESEIREYNKKMEKLRLDDEEKLSRLESNDKANLHLAQDYLMLSTSSLGWINCDRFDASPQKVDYLVKLKEKASVLIVFDAIKSIMSSDSQGTFKNVPLNEKITIVGLKTEGGKLMMAYHETTVTAKPFDGLSFKPVTVKEYKRKLEHLNRM